MTASENEIILEQLTFKRDGLLKKRLSIQKFFYLIIGVALVAIVVVPIIIWRVDYDYSGLISLYIIIPFAILPFIRMHIKNLDDELRSIDFEMDLQKFEVSKKKYVQKKFF